MDIGLVGAVRGPTRRVSEEIGEAGGLGRGIAPTLAGASGRSPPGIRASPGPRRDPGPATSLQSQKPKEFASVEASG